MHLGRERIHQNRNYTIDISQTGNEYSFILENTEVEEIWEL